MRPESVGVVADAALARASRRRVVDAASHHISLAESPRRGGIARGRMTRVMATHRETIVGQLLPSSNSTATPDSRSARRGLDPGRVGKWGRAESAAGGARGPQGRRRGGRLPRPHIALRWMARGPREVVVRCGSPSDMLRGVASGWPPSLGGWGARGGPVPSDTRRGWGVRGAEGTARARRAIGVGASAVRERESLGCARGARAPPLYRDVPARRSDWRRRRGRRRVAGTYLRSL